MKAIQSDIGKRSGQPCVRDTRMTVADVLGYLAAGMTEQEIIDDFPVLTKQDFKSVYEYAAGASSSNACMLIPVSVIEAKDKLDVPPFSELWKATGKSLSKEEMKRRQMQAAAEGNTEGTELKRVPPEFKYWAFTKLVSGVIGQGNTAREAVLSLGEKLYEHYAEAASEWSQLLDSSKSKVMDEGIILVFQQD